MGPSLKAAILTFVYSIQGTPGDKAKTDYIFVDLFEASSARIASLKPRKVICYFSTQFENWRPDAKQFPKEALGKPLGTWEGERWVDYRNDKVRAVLTARMDLAKSKKCDGIDPDNIDGHTTKTGFPLTATTQKQFMQFLSDYAHKKGMLIGLKNSAETAKSLDPLVDFAVVEECAKYKECGKYSKRPMFQIEYTKLNQKVCDDAKARGNSVIFADLKLTKFEFCK